MLKLLILFISTILLSSCGSFTKRHPLKLPKYRNNAHRTPNSTSEFYFSWPLEKASMTRGFAPRRLNHFGLDLAKPKGSPIMAAHPGYVVYTGSGFSGYGKLVIVEHPETGWASMYAHCNRILVREGQWVNNGQHIATVGNTGNARGVHLHFELRQDERAVDPLDYLP